MATIGINGFGRMGRLGLRAAWGNPAFTFTQVNEIAGNAATSAHLLKFDSIHGIWSPECSADDDNMLIAGQTIAYTSNKAIEDTDWSGCDIVLECSGKFRKIEQLQAYFDQGVKKVIVAAPVEGALNIVYGVNDDWYKPEEHHLITAASCTTNCLAPVVKVMHEKVGIKHGCMTTLHNITNTQTIIDKGHKDLRRARACGESMIPTTTGSAKAITKIFPELAGKLNGHAVRIPLLNASLTDFVFEAAREVTAEELNGYFKEASETYLKDILGYEERPLVSVDYKHDPRSSIIDAPSTMVIDGTQVKIYAWYDNEWGYMNRMMELAAKVVASLP
ncbi:ArsJ-associated glyceraldehyde-3-phosphate dehydrogenase [Thiothrix subterranea]|uniref:Glyceraldehyde-3-phosphate dehydrogenase n=1 Tax=Thiothrix subterranea TaxID=2735563 RepID=A0AA51R549_9GAMM|nr:ArsJ-associated glyceraldehyde-3-phosphate dehydrogenase [Thiothrix subterranea]MDQ5769163.1 ArsJ-associated glyceraldehyde-3-phosphate dehydrogenase [Thiothrix subterranea]WML87321.1 ArsJ-associated glyceraldehyde-3-phosphate dehydrogenase [Thiothrix subterranea]